MKCLDKSAILNYIEELKSSLEDAFCSLEDVVDITDEYDDEEADNVNDVMCSVEEHINTVINELDELKKELE